MDLKNYSFPKHSHTDKKLLEEARSKGFYNGHTLYNKLFSTLFFGGGKVKFKEGVDAELKNNAWPYCRFFMQSWSPKHEEKEAICALIMSEILEPELDK